MIRPSATTRGLAIAAAVTLTSCTTETQDMSTDAATRAPSAPATQAGAPLDPSLRAIATRRIYFGHQSVGENIIAGIDAALAERPELGLKLVMTKEPSVLAGPAFVHFYAGRNTDPASKNADFLKVLDARPRPDSGIALLKYCYVDMDARTDVDKLFADYQKLVAEVRRKHPDVTLVHVTMPLTTVETANKARIKRLLGKTTVRDVNAKRNRYNTLLRAAYAGKEPMFDIAELESTHADGRRSFFAEGADTVYTLAEELTTDGGHLNERAQRIAADRLLAVLAGLLAGVTAGGK